MKRRSFLQLMPGAAAGSRASLGRSLQNSSPAASQMAREFLDPPAAARPRTWWHWMNGNITAEGITRDLEAMARIGVRGFQIFQVGTGIPKGPVDYGSPQHMKLLEHAFREAERLGLECDLHNCPGWSSSGGPWNRPEHSMKIVTWSETPVKGGARVAVRLPQPPARLNFYRDIAVVAFPALDGEESPLRSRVRSVRASLVENAEPAPLDAAQLDALFGDNPRGGLSVQISAGLKSAAIVIEFAEAVEVRSFSCHAAVAGPAVGGFGGPGGAAALEVSSDGSRYEKAADLSLQLGPMLDGFPLAPATASFPAVRGRFFRILLPPNRRVSSVRLSAAARLKDWPVKTNCLHHARGRGEELFSATPDVHAASVIDPGRIVDLTSRMQPDGQLEWDAPAGTWTLLRIGYTTTARTNHPGPDGGVGLECDKYSAEAMEHHFNAFFGPMLRDLERLGKRGLAGALIDSYEVGMQNWTDRMREEFRRRAGYDLLPYLPCFTGRIIASAETTERFLWDLRRVQADMMADHYYGKFTELCHRHGIKSYTEPYDGGPFEEVQIGTRMDVNMGEFWYGRRNNLDRSMKLASSIAHLKGQKAVGAEAFTGMPMFSRWQEHPYAMKAQGDWMFTQGLTLCIFHRYAHQPHPGALPGMTMGPWGFHFDRTNTWFEKAGPWIDYLSRCQYLLQQGQPVADLLYYIGEDAPLDTPDPAELNPPLPRGYDFDFVNTEVLLRETRIEQGRIVLAGGPQYRLLVLPERRTMTLRVLRRLHELVRAGLWLSGPKPARSPSLADQNAAAEWSRLAGELWGRADGKAVKENRLGQGRVFWGEPLDSILSQMGVPPDFECTSQSGDAPVNFIHRRTADADIYFIACRRRQPEDIVASFRVSGAQPEIWSADSGHAAPAPVFEVKDGRTCLPLQLDPAGSAFVIFRRTNARPAVRLVRDASASSPLISASAFPRPARGRHAQPAGTFTVAAWIRPDTYAILASAAAAAPGMFGAPTSFVFYPPDGETAYGAGHAACGLVAGRNGLSVVERSAGRMETVLQADLGLAGWTHVALVYEDNTPALYVDGKLAQRGKRSSRIVHPGLGESFQEDGAGFLEGDQTPPRLFPRALSADEIAAQARQGPPPLVPHRRVELAFQPKPGLLLWQPGRYFAEGTRPWEVRVGALPPPLDLRGPWTVSFPSGLGAPASIRLEHLQSLHLHPEPGVRHFSGTAGYETSFEWNASPEPSRRVFLDLGRIGVIAEVMLNGKRLGTLWKPPFRLDVTEAVQRGPNRLRVDVTNLWLNRLIGDEQLPPENEYGAAGGRAGFGNAITKLPEWFVNGQPKPPGGRITFATWKHWSGDAPLSESGLIGPVLIEVAEFWPLPEQT